MTNDERPRLARLIVALALVLAVIAGCGGSPGEDESTDEEDAA